MVLVFILASAAHISTASVVVVAVGVGEVCVKRSRKREKVPWNSVRGRMKRALCMALLCIVHESVGCCRMITKIAPSGGGNQSVVLGNELRLSRRRSSTAMSNSYREITQVSTLRFRHHFSSASTRCCDSEE
jgi:hypothetical protein